MDIGFCDKTSYPCYSFCQQCEHYCCVHDGGDDDDGGDDVGGDVNNR